MSLLYCINCVAIYSFDFLINVWVADVISHFVYGHGNINISKLYTLHISL